MVRKGFHCNEVLPWLLIQWLRVSVYFPILHLQQLNLVKHDFALINLEPLPHHLHMLLTLALSVSKEIISIVGCVLRLDDHNCVVVHCEMPIGEEHLL